MKKLAQMKQGQTGVVTAINGDARYTSRITSIGITPGCVRSYYCCGMHYIHVAGLLKCALSVRREKPVPTIKPAPVRRVYG